MPKRPRAASAHSCPPVKVGHAACLGGQEADAARDGEDIYEGVAGEGQPAEEAEEGRAAKPLRLPCLPSPKEIEAHSVSHIPFRAWCSHCVRGRGKS